MKTYHQSIFQLKQIVLYTSPWDIHLNLHFKSVKWTKTWSHIWISKLMVSDTGVRCRAASTLSQWFMFTAHPGLLKPRGLWTACWERAGRQKLAKNLPGISLPSLRRCISAQALILCLFVPSLAPCWPRWLPGLPLGWDRYDGHRSLGCLWSWTRHHTTVLVGVVGLCSCWCSRPPCPCGAACSLAAWYLYSKQIWSYMLKNN